ncbi:glycoside hydrolase, partial [Dipodascopsis uninucleata]
EEVFNHPKKVNFPISDAIKLPEEPPIALAKVQGSFGEETAEQHAEREARLVAVKEAFNHSWSGYKKYAWGHDEVRPVSGKYSDSFGGWGASIVDALDTLIIMGFDEELKDAKAFLETIDFRKMSLPSIPVFETNIRYLGGLISAYDLSPNKDRIFLTKAVELANILLGAFDTPNGLPVLFYDPKLAHSDIKLRAGAFQILAQFGSLSLEFTRLAQITGNDTFYSAIQHITDLLEESERESPIRGLWPLRMDISGCEVANTIKDKAMSTSTGTRNSVRQQQQQTSQDVNMQQLQKRDSQVGIDYDAVNSQIVPSTDSTERAKLVLSKSDAFIRSALDFKPVSPSCVAVKGLTESDRQRSSRRFSAGALGDSTYEYFIKEYLLLGGTVEQYKRLHLMSIESIKNNLIYRPMVKDQADILFSGNVILDASGQRKFDPEMTHLTCYIGGMYALGAKVLERPDDLVTAQKLADGCYWAYNQTRTGIMPENFHVREFSIRSESVVTKDDVVVDSTDAHKVPLDDKVVPKDLDKQTEESSAMIENQKETKPNKINSEPIMGADTGSYKSSANPNDLNIDRDFEKDTKATVDGDLAQEKAINNDKDEKEFSGTGGSDSDTISKTSLTEGGVGGVDMSFTSQDGRYLLRPEALESIFIMYRVTGDKKWQDKGWEMFSAINKFCRTEIAYSAIRDVTNSEHIEYLDQMESFWMAETLKYAYLLFADPSIISLDDYVFNTEAHPFLRP